MTDEELKALVASLAVSQKVTDEELKALAAGQKETDRLFQENAQQQKETAQKFQETDRLFKETDKQLKELGKQIGGLGNKFGGFTEGMAFPSMSRVLEEDLGMDSISRRAKKKRNGKGLEVDVLGYSNGKANAVYVVEVKSLLNEEALRQTLHTLEQFPHFFTEHGDKALHGILAYVDFKEGMLEQALQAGLYVACLQNDLFDLQAPQGFVPKNFQAETR